MTNYDNNCQLNSKLIETMSASDKNSNMPILRNEFSKILGDLFTMKKFTEMTHI